MLYRLLRIDLWRVSILLPILIVAAAMPGQTPPSATHAAHVSVAKYFDQVNGRTADDLVAYALANNAELFAMRKEAEAGEALIRQARLRPNPSVAASRAEQVGGMDSMLMVEGMLPLELGGRRGARIRVAEREAEIRRQALAQREVQLATEVRTKFGESLAAVFKLGFAEEILGEASESYQLVATRVTEGRRPPLEQNMVSVELNRMRVMREMSEATVEIRMLELRNLLGMGPETTFRLHGDFGNLLAPLPSQREATELALETRPDLLGARAVELLAAARVEQARTEGRIDAGVSLGYQRTRMGFPFLGVQETTGALLPINSKFHFFTFGVKLDLPVRNRNQGMIEAAILEEEAARKRREFGELTIRREVAVAYARHNRAVRAAEIYRVGVRDQAAANLDVVRQTYELGSKTLLDYIAEHHRFIEVENGFIDAQLEAYLAMVDVLKASNDPTLK